MFKLKGEIYDLFWPVLETSKNSNNYGKFILLLHKIPSLIPAVLLDNDGL